MHLEDFQEFSCPYCGGTNTLPIDVSGGSNQKFVVDCEVCCAPIVLRLKISGGEIISVDARRENE
jgi:hypothetical protein